MIELVIGAVLAAVAAPHFAPLHRVAPVTACAVWLAALSVRSLLTFGTVLLTLAWVPQTTAFATVANWSPHEVLPVLSLHLDLSGEPLAHSAVLLPGAVLAASLVAFVATTAAAWLALRGWLRGSVLGSGPGGSVVVADRRVLVGVTRLGRARILVSDGALRALDRQELRACLAHEAGHLKRRHRGLRLLAALLSRAAVPLPGTRAAERGLSLGLERDADEYAVERTGDPLALASAICKTARSELATGYAPAASVLSATGGERPTLRVEYLLTGGRARAPDWLERLALALATILGALAVLLGGALGIWLALGSPFGQGIALAIACQS